MLLPKQSGLVYALSTVIRKPFSMSLIQPELHPSQTARTVSAMLFFV
jgi:hypothetical protein